MGLLVNGPSGGLERKDGAFSEQMRLEDEAAARVTTESKPCVILKYKQRLVASVDVRQKERTRQKVPT